MAVDLVDGLGPGAADLPLQSGAEHGIHNQPRFSGQAVEGLYLAADRLPGLGHSQGITLELTGIT